MACNAQSVRIGISETRNSHTHSRKATTEKKKTNRNNNNNSTSNSQNKLTNGISERATDERTLEFFCAYVNTFLFNAIFTIKHVDQARRENYFLIHATAIE